ncbi:MAG TPA: ribokinase [Terracidiphilus sp.]
MVVGSINIDLVATSSHIPFVGETIIGTDFQIHPGGKGANQAVAVGRLGYPVHMIGRIGSDAFGSQLVANLHSAGVDCSGVAISEGASGVAVILVSEQGENCIVVAPGANAKVTPRDVDANLAVIRQAGIVLAQLEIPVETVEHLAEVCDRERIPLILDPAPARPLSGKLLQSVTWLTPNESEAALYCGANGSIEAWEDPETAAQRIKSGGSNGVVLKLGARGAFVASTKQKGELVPAFQVRAVDTTAAGDAFNGAFATALMLGQSPGESARFGAAAAAISVTRPGAQPSMPTFDEVQELINSHSVQAKSA